MTDRGDVDRLTAAQRRLVQQARNELAGYFGTLDLSQPGAVRDALLEVVPTLVREYGTVAATAAAEWYEDIHPGRYLAQTAPLALDDQVQGSVRYAAGHLFGDDPAGTLATLNGALQRYISYGSRATVARNVSLDPSKPRFARVPTGAKTCAWCTLLASRGFVYHSRATAGDPSVNRFHDDDDCAVVPEWDRDTAHIDGYDPDRFYDMYLQARDAAGGTTDEDIAAQMRRMFPDEFTDGVHEHDA